MKKFAPTGISLPLKLIHEIDLMRGDVSRSRYILKLIQIALNTSENAPSIFKLR